MIEHARECSGVVAGSFRLVHRVGHGDATPGRAPHEEVLRLGAHAHDIAGFGQPLDLAAQDDPGGIGPQLAQHEGIALDDPQPRLPGRRHVGGQVGHGQDVRRRGGLAHRPRSEACEARSVFQQAVDGRDRDHFGARLAVHVHEHGEEELDPVPLGRVAQLRRTRDRGRLSLQRARQVRSPHMSWVSCQGFMSTMLPGGKRRMVTCGLTTSG